MVLRACLTDDRSIKNALEQLMRIFDSALTFDVASKMQSKLIVEDDNDQIVNS
jgi:hypothetical protein